MTHETPQFDIEDVWHALERLDPPHELADQLAACVSIGRASTRWSDPASDLMPVE
ncbi:hypothetical protein ACQP1G_25785 [Nocardia sp. CA-107356]|uniref:hypothetical protein n=1 Tax=Nocardia sp. CA-107356 TaxID=3239972 RepID=UPI003D8DECBF